MRFPAMIIRGVLAITVVSLLPLVACDAPQEAVQEEAAFVKGEVIVRYHKDLPEWGEAEFQARHALKVRQRFPSIRVDHLEIEDGVDVESKLQALRADPDVLYAEPNYLYYPTELPNDWSAKLWGLHNDGTYGSADADIDAREAWSVSTGSSSVVVAVIDTGIDWEHPDLQPNLWVNAAEYNGSDGVDDDHNGYVDDIIGWDFVNNDQNPADQEGHGTHVSGTIGAAGNNGTGVVGVNWDVSIMACRFIGPYGGTTSAAVSAIEYAVDNGAQIINASWGGPGSSTAIEDAISYANDHGVLFVTAAGNDGRNSDYISNYPNNYNLPNIVSVAATTPRDGLASFSNYGRSTVDVGAPGESIYSTWPGGGYQWLDGTSMASPMAAGAAALALSVDPSLTAAELKALLMNTADPVSALSSTTVSGGRINVANMLAALGGSAPEEPEEDPPEEPEDPAEDPAPDTDQGTTDPAEWTFVEYAVSSPHPYGNDFNGYAVIQAAGASEIMLAFQKLSVEQGYDFVTIDDQYGNEVARYTGDLGTFTSDPVEGNMVTLRLITDYSVTGYGLDLAGYYWR